MLMVCVMTQTVFFNYTQMKINHYKILNINYLYNIYSYIQDRKKAIDNKLDYLYAFESPKSTKL
jgi:hypothetical protein